MLQILHYQFGERYEPHWDYFVDPVNAVNGGQRLATMLIYLSDVEEGGETVFPSSEEKPARATPAYIHFPYHTPCWQDSIYLLVVR